MAKIFLREFQYSTNGDLPSIGSNAPDFKLTKIDLSTSTLDDYRGFTLIMNIFPSIDTSTCASSVRTFNKRATELPNTKVICISRDLPFAQKRFCGAEGIENVITGSDFAVGAFGKAYGVELLDGKLQFLHARAVVVIDPVGIVKYTELVSDMSNEPDYDAAIASI